MIIDFRIRPPYKSQLNTSIFGFRGKSEPAEENKTIFNMRKVASASMLEGSVDLLIQEMDETGTEMGILMGRKADDHGDVDNNDSWELMQKYPGRFIGFAGLNPLLPGQIEEMEKWAAKGFRGIGLDLGWLRKELYIDDPIMYPIYARCQELGLIASITCSFMLGADMTFSDPNQIMRVATKFPKLKIVVPHACWPHVNYALAMAIRCPNVYLMPDCYVYIHGFPMSEEYVKAANEYLKYRILYCSTYPVYSLMQAKEGWITRDFTPEAIERTMYLNAKKLLGL